MVSGQNNLKLNELMKLMAIPGSQASCASLVSIATAGGPARSVHLPALEHE